MTTPSDQASPAGDIVAWRTQQGTDARTGLLTPDLVALAQNGVSAGLAARDGEGRPVVGLGIGCRVRADGALRILLSRAANPRLLAALADGSPVAATFTGAPSHRAFQVKASGARIVEAASDDLPEIERQSVLLRDGLVEIGFSPEVATGYLAFDPAELIAIEFTPEKVFTQTPGPGAGAELKP